MPDRKRVYPTRGTPGGGRESILFDTNEGQGKGR